MGEVPTVEIGDVVEYRDAVGKSFNAIVTAIWGLNSPTMSINLVYTVDDENSTDQYGRQIARDTSVPHESNQAAHGRKWAVR